MNRERINSLIFFIILLTLIFYLLGKNGIIAYSAVSILLYGVGVVFLVLMSRPMVVIFRTILKITGFVGKIVFTILNLLVFYFLVTPVAGIMKVFGKRFVDHRYDHSLDSYYQGYDPGNDIEKQF
jgi:hypothetical protein